MGITGRLTMPLIATLAALVIIVHSAEEDMETDYRHEIRSRVLETETANHNQPWRTMEETKIPQGQIDDWDKAPEENPKRRRPGRKRKRRPHPGADEDFTPKERIVYPDDSDRPYFDVDSPRQTTDFPIRRRKKPDARPIRWTDESAEYDRPFRRRSQRRKRPLLEPWPELSEYNQYKPGDSRTHLKPINEQDDENPRKHFALRDFDKESELTEKRILEIDALETGQQKPFDFVANTYVKNNFKDDRSLSEFSPEILPSAVQRLNTKHEDENINEQYSEKILGTFKSYKKAKESNDDSPITLKDLLKRSNGTSLSEILQQHNLSLTDLLNGKENAISILNTKSNQSSETNNLNETIQGLEPPEVSAESDEKLENSETKYATESAIATTLLEYPTTTEEIHTTTDMTNEAIILIETTTTRPVEDNTLKIVTNRRFPLGVRKKLRMRPMMNDTFKAQLSRDLVTLNSRKYAHHRRNSTKYKEWKDVIPAMNKNNISTNFPQSSNKLSEDLETPATRTVSEEATLILNTVNDTSVLTDSVGERGNKLDDINMDVAEVTTETNSILAGNNNADRPSVVSMARPTAISSGLRRQAFNNRLKRKRMKNKSSTTEPPQDDFIKHLLGMGNLVSSSEFIARTQEPNDFDNNEFTTIEDFMTTESTSNAEIVKSRHASTPSTAKPVLIQTTTEETAKIEIEEIFNDTRTSAKLSKILRERNMTLSELMAHRERGSSHVHLADIFHNASREPNPPEPFLSKSVIEPISKEIYPLRAILEANLHDPTAKATTMDSDQNITELSKVNIPVVMDYRNNVNENAENMGIMSLFNNFTKDVDKSALKKHSEGRPYKTSIIPLNITKTNTSEPVRESRVINNYDDVVSWNEIFSLMRKNRKNGTEPINNVEESAQQKPLKNIRLEEDVDGDGVIVLEDLQHLKDFESNIASGSDEKLEVKTFEQVDEAPHATGILETIPSQTKSVTVATASIAGLAMILFLLTYAVFKWREQKSNVRKKRSFIDDRIPTPVFENRKGHKNHSSMRSISPMLQTSNIYTLNTLDSNAGKESPDYMWDSLKKPFQ